MAHWRPIRFQALDFSSQTLPSFLHFKHQFTAAAQEKRNDEHVDDYIWEIWKEFKEMYDRWWIANTCCLM